MAAYRMRSVRIGLVSSAVPLVHGGYRFIVEWLEQKLRESGHEVENVMVPSHEDPDTILQQMTAFRLMRLEDYYDRVVTFRPPSHVVRHPRKVVWFIHHFRVFYDLWDSPYRPFPDTAPMRALRDAVRTADTRALNEAHRVFSNSRTVSERLWRFNGVAADVLYPPVLQAERFRSGDHGDEIVSVCRIEPHKRQHLLVEAMQHVRTPVRLRLFGASLSQQYPRELLALVERHGLEGRVAIENRWITEEESKTVCPPPRPGWLVLRCTW
jgi:glycosyltransferase involved in cell wall biosynthesis